MLRRAAFIRALESTTGFSDPTAAAEQYVTPPEAAAELLFEALAREDLRGLRVLDLGTGTGRLAIGAALLGARNVIGVERDRSALRLAQANAERLGVRCEWIEAPVDSYDQPADTVVMNPPFGAQRKHADAPFWHQALTLAGRAVYAFSLAESRTFIARQAVARAARIEATRPIRWDLPATFPHHRKPRVSLAVDLWVLRTEQLHR